MLTYLLMISSLSTAYLYGHSKEFQKYIFYYGVIKSPAHVLVLKSRGVNQLNYLKCHIGT